MLDKMDFVEEIWVQLLALQPKLSVVSFIPKFIEVNFISNLVLLGSIAQSQTSDPDTF